MTEPHVLGQVVKVSLPDVSDKLIEARVDTGAKTSSIWVSKTRKTEAGLKVTFFAQDCEHFSDRIHTFKEYDKVTVISTNGVSEQRYKVRLTIVVAGRPIKAWFTLADRSSLTYPVLIGRNVLRGKFIVDVSKK